MKILVTGCAGFIGSHLTERLLAASHQVIGLDSFDTTLYGAEIKKENLAPFQKHPSFELVKGSLLELDRLKEITDGVELVVHLAALAGVRPSIAEPSKYARTNVEGTVNVYEACVQNGITRVVFASSSSVYGARSPEDVPFRESDPCLRPASPYAATKRAGELLASTYRDVYGIGTYSLRYFTVYGPRQRPEMAIHKFTRAIANDQKVPVFGDGSSARDYTYIDDIIDGTMAAIDKVRPGEIDVFNLGNSTTTTLKELVELIGEAMGKKPVIDWQPAQPGDVPITYADVSRSNEKLGYDPQVPIAEGIKRFVAWYLTDVQSRST